MLCLLNQALIQFALRQVRAEHQPNRHHVAEHSCVRQRQRERFLRARGLLYGNSASQLSPALYLRRLRSVTSAVL
jgi:hypothetical protein